MGVREGEVGKAVWEDPLVYVKCSRGTLSFRFHSKDEENLCS